MAYIYSSLAKAKQDNAPGTKSFIYVAPIDKFTTIEKPVAAGAGDGDTVEITADHTFGVGDGFIKLYTTKDTQELIAELVGERDSEVFNHKFECSHPGLSKEVLEFLNWAKDDQFIVLIPELDGSYLQLGMEDLGCDIKSAYGTGKLSGGYKGSKLTCESFHRPLKYAGTVTIV